MMPWDVLGRGPLSQALRGRSVPDYKGDCPGSCYLSEGMSAAGLRVARWLRLFALQAIALPDCLSAKLQHGNANLVCLALLWWLRTLNINMNGTFECSRNDVAANIVLLVAAGGVALAGSGWPHIAAGAVIALLFLESTLGMIGEAWPA